MGPAHDGSTVYGGLGHLAIALAELGRFEAAATVYSTALKTFAAAAHPAYGWTGVEEGVIASIGTTAYEAARAVGDRIDREGAVAIVLAALDAVDAETASSIDSPT
jgi:hypothetical protein